MLAQAARKIAIKIPMWCPSVAAVVKVKLHLPPKHKIVFVELNNKPAKRV